MIDPQVDENRKKARRKYLFYGLLVVFFSGVIIAAINERNKRKNNKGKTSQDSGDQNMSETESKERSSTGSAVVLIGSVLFIVAGGIVYAMHRNAKSRATVTPQARGAERAVHKTRPVKGVSRVGTAYADGLCLFHSLLEASANRKGSREEGHRFAERFVEFAKRETSKAPDPLVQKLRKDEILNVDHWVRYVRGEATQRPLHQPDLGVLGEDLSRFMGKSIQVHRPGAKKALKYGAKQNGGVVKIQYLGDGESGHYQPILGPAAS